MTGRPDWDDQFHESETERNARLAEKRKLKAQMDRAHADAKLGQEQKALDSRGTEATTWEAVVHGPHKKAVPGEISGGVAQMIGFGDAVCLVSGGRSPADHVGSDD